MNHVKVRVVPDTPAGSGWCAPGASCHGTELLELQDRHQRPGSGAVQGKLHVRFSIPLKTLLQLLQLIQVNILLCTSGMVRLSLGKQLAQQKTSNVLGKIAQSGWQLLHRLLKLRETCSNVLMYASWCSVSKEKIFCISQGVLSSS